MSKLADRAKPEPYRFEPTHERAVVRLSCNSTNFWKRIGRVLDPESMTEGPARLAMRGAREIAAETGDGPASEKQVLQRLRYWMQLGRITQDERLAVEDLLDRADEERETWPEEAAVTEARKVVKPILEQQAIIRAHTEWSARGDLSKVADEMVEASRVGEAQPDGPTIVETPWPVLDAAALHGPAGEFVRRVEPHTEADPAGLLVQFLVAAGGVLGRGPWTVAGGADHYANLFAVVVGQTAKSRKGTALSHVARFFREVDAETWKLISKSGLSSGEGVIHAVRDRRTEMKEKDDGTWEEVTIDPGAKDKRLLVVESEFARPLIAGGRKDSTLSSVLRSAWDSGDLRNLVRTAAEHATAAHVALIGHITEGELSRTLAENDTSNGFANRILWALVRRTKLLPDDDGFRVELDLHDLIEEVGLRLGVVDRLAAASVGEIAGAAARRATTSELDAEWLRDAAAKELWRDTLYPRLATEGDDPTDPTADVVCRGEAQVVRLSLVYSVLDGCHEIRPEHLLAADAVWRYCRDSARRIFGAAPRKRDIPAERVVMALRDVYPEGMTRYAIRRDVFQGHISKETLADLLGRLLRRGLVRRGQTPTKGRPVETWYAVAGPRAESALSAGSPTAAPPSSANSAYSAPLPAGVVCAWGPAGPTPRAESALSAGSPPPSAAPETPDHVEPEGAVDDSFHFGAVGPPPSTETDAPPPPPPAPPESP